MKMNVRRWRFGFVDNDGCKRFDWIKGISKKHVRAIIKSRCKNGHQIKSLYPDKDSTKTTYRRPFGKITLAIWEAVTTPKTHSTVI